MNWLVDIGLFALVGDMQLLRHRASSGQQSEQVVAR